MQSIIDQTVPSLATVSEGYAQWRASGISRRSTPEHLQQQTVALLKHYPKRQVCQSLNISYSALKQWILRAMPENAASQPDSVITADRETGFIPLPGATTPDSLPESVTGNPTPGMPLRITFPSGVVLSATVPLSTLLTLINQPITTHTRSTEPTS